MSKPSLSVFIGRFQPLHNGHLSIITEGLKISDRILILIGSATNSRNIKNPFTYQQRSEMIMSWAAENNVADRVITQPLSDNKYDDAAWAASVQDAVSQMAIEDVTLVGHDKDASTYYLQMFPQWKQHLTPSSSNVNATDVRYMLFTYRNRMMVTGVVPEAAMKVIDPFMQSAEFKRLTDEHDMLVKYQKAWAAAPYPPTFVTVDAVVIKSGHILMIERMSAPGEGLLALPGGFLDQREWIVDGALRELREETKLKVPEPVLRRSIKHQQVFDDPSRSLRGRTITHAFLFDLGNGALPRVKGSDDARSAIWVPISELKQEEIFEDHYHIIKAMVR